MAVLVYSGGLDSTVLLYKLIKDGIPVTALTFDYGQTHKREIESAKKICELLKVPHKIVDISNLGVLSNSALLGDVELPKSDYSVDTQKKTVVPNRNMILLALAIGYAESNDQHAVYIAVHRNDYAVYPDCRPVFISAMNHASKLGTYKKIAVKAPFLELGKDIIVGIGMGLKVPFDMTWSCYEGGEKPCGTCGTCRERKIAFENAEANLRQDDEA